MILLDTHALVWLAAARERMSERALEEIRSTSSLAISIASAQEIAYLSVRGRLAMDRPVGEWIGDALRAHSVRALSPTISTSVRAGSLDPRTFHGDPVDRLIYATAVEEDAHLVTADERLREFDPGRVIW